MNLNKKCSCGAILTTKNVSQCGRMPAPNQNVLLVNCRHCLTTVVLNARVSVEIDRAHDGEFSGGLSSDSLPPSIQRRLGLSSRDSVDLDVTGEFEIDIDDASECLAEALFVSLTVWNGDRSVDLTGSDLDVLDIERQLNRVIDWDSFWQNLESSAIDRAFEERFR